MFEAVSKAKAGGGTPSAEEMAASQAAGNEREQRERQRATRNYDRSASENVLPALLAHHQYDQGSIGNYDPISLVKLKKEFGIKKATAFRWFKTHFGGHQSYRVACKRDRGKPLQEKLKTLNDNYAPFLTVDPTRRKTSTRTTTSRRISDATGVSSFHRPSVPVRLFWPTLHVLPRERLACLAFHSFHWQRRPRWNVSTRV